MKQERNINIEYFRILCCIYVLCNHILSGYAYGKNYISNNILHFLGTLNRMAVPGFFMITGFFLFRKEKKYSYILKKSLKLFIPAIIIIVLTQVLNPFLLHEKGLIECLIQFKFDIINTIDCTLNFNSYENPNTYFLFFVFEYIQLLLLYPIFKLICSDNDKCKMVRKYLILYTLITQLLLSNIFEFINNLSIGLPQLIRIKYMYVLIGYEIYLRLKKGQLHFNAKNYNLKCVSIYLLMGIIQYMLFYYKTKYFLFSYDEEIKFMTSESFTIFFSTISLFLLFLNLDFTDIPKFRKKLVDVISKNTYNIYLFHWSVMIYLENSLIKPFLLKYYGFYTPFIMVFLCFLICLFLSIILKYICKLITKIFLFRWCLNEKN